MAYFTFDLPARRPEGSWEGKEGAGRGHAGIKCLSGRRPHYPLTRVIYCNK